MPHVSYSREAFCCCIPHTVTRRTFQHRKHRAECKNIPVPKPAKNQTLNLFAMQAVPDRVCVPSVLYKDSSHKDSERARGPVMPLITVINAVLLEENTYPRNKNNHLRIRYVLCEIPTAFAQRHSN